jgi:hypothetical protein
LDNGDLLMEERKGASDEVIEDIISREEASLIQASPKKII